MTDQHPDTGEPPASRRISRRTVLKAAGIGGGAIVLAGAAGLGIRAGTNGAWNGGRGEPYALWQDWREAPGMLRLVAAGTLAANPHNIQAWSFVVGDDRVDLFADPSRRMPLGDPDGRERIAGYGCVVENLVLAARSMTLDAQVTTWPASDPDHVARVELTRGSAASTAEGRLAEAISARHTDRGPYAAGPVDSHVLDGLAAGAPGGAEVAWVTDPAALSELGDLYVEATQAIVDDEPMSREAFSWFRNDRADIDRHRDGLTLDCQGLDGFTLFLAKILPAQSRADGDAFWVGATRDTHTATARAYGIVRVGDTGDARARFDGGRLLEHVHLAATAAGLGLHHMNQVSERIARDTMLGDSDRFSRRWAEITGVPADESLLAFRVGYPERTAEPSPRRSLADVVRES